MVTTENFPSLLQEGAGVTLEGIASIQLSTRRDKSVTVIPFKVVILGHRHHCCSEPFKHHLKSGNYSSFEGGFTFWKTCKGTLSLRWVSKSGGLGWGGSGRVSG